MYAPVPYSTATTEINPGGSIADFPDHRPILVFYSIMHTVFPLLNFCSTDAESSNHIGSENFSE